MSKIAKSEVGFGCVNNTILLRSGIYFDLANPQPEFVRVDDIAGALSKICRFGGQCPLYYSVAEHCCHCFDAAIDDGLGLDIAELCLFHDAAEAFVGDVVKPLKTMLQDFSLIESAVESAINQSLDLRWTPEGSRCVKRIDMEMLIAERMAIFGNDGVEWTGQSEVSARDVCINYWTPIQAEVEFLKRASRCGI